MNPELPFWLRLAGGLAIEIAVIAILAALFERTRRGWRHGNRVWKAALLTIALVSMGELAGLREGIQGWVLRFPGMTSRSLALRDAPPTHEGPVTADTASAAASPTRRSAPTAWWPGILWMAGTLLLTLRLAGGRLWWALRHRRAVPATEDLRRRAAQVAATLGLPAVTVVFWKGIRSPFAYGIRRRGIAVPPDFTARFSGPQQDAMLAHELAHLAARDPAWLVLADLVVAVAWWHPLTWWARRRLQGAMERHADGASRVLPEGSLALAESLVALADQLTAPAHVRALGMAGAGRRSDLARRIKSLLHDTIEWCPPSAGARCLGLLLALTVAGGFLGMAWPGAPDGSLRSLIPSAQAPIDPPRPLPPGPEPRPTALPEPAATPTSVSAPGPGPAEVPSAPPPSAADDEILLEVKVLTLEDRGDQDLGLDWLFGQGPDDDAPVTVTAPAGDLPGAGSAHLHNIRIETSRIEGQVARLTGPQFSTLLKRFEARGGAELLSTPRVQTRSGLQAQLAIVDSRTIVTGVEGQAGEGTNAAGVNYLTETLPVGVTVDVLPWRSNGAWAVTTVGRVTEFLGYDDPGDFAVTLEDGTRTSVSYQRPLPRLRARETAATGLVARGETLVLRGPVETRSLREKRGWLRRDRVVTERRRLYVFVTPLPVR